MNAVEIVRAAIPEATEDQADLVLWARTPYPFRPVSPRELYKAASGFYRASIQGIELCDWCERVVEPGQWTCVKCGAALLAVKGGRR